MQRIVCHLKPNSVGYVGDVKQRTLSPKKVPGIFRIIVQIFLKLYQLFWYDHGNHDLDKNGNNHYLTLEWEKSRRCVV
jgi:hypothetical protein